MHLEAIQQLSEEGIEVASFRSREHVKEAFLIRHMRRHSLFDDCPAAAGQPDKGASPVARVWSTLEEAGLGKAVQGGVGQLRGPEQTTEKENVVNASNREDVPPTMLAVRLHAPGGLINCVSRRSRPRARVLEKRSFASTRRR
jgi:hypothetical protein